MPRTWTLLAPALLSMSLLACGDKDDEDEDEDEDDEVEDEDDEALLAAARGSGRAVAMWAPHALHDHDRDSAAS